VGRYGVVWTADQRRILRLDNFSDACGTNDGWIWHRKHAFAPCEDCQDARDKHVESLHGTYAGYMIHRHSGTEPCPACKEAAYLRHRRNRIRRQEQSTSGWPRRPGPKDCGYTRMDTDPDHAAHCGPARGFRVCYCRCPKCWSPEDWRCICEGCGAAHGERRGER
jgi:hypothetical protein